jgi:hypothetical protein
MKILRAGFIAAAVLASMSDVRAQGYQDIEQPSLPAASPGANDLNAVARLTSAEVDIDPWSPIAAQAARLLIDKYGAPDEIRPAYLAWHQAGPWARTVVFDTDGPTGDGRDIPLIEQTLGYPLKPAQVAALASFDRRVAYNERTGELSVRSETEELNFLRMNLADDVASGRKSPLGARAEFDRAVSLSASGKRSPAMRGLHFPFGLPSE